ncbi:MAG: class II aldolase/adducin family protein [Burkholderiales bacterium]|nr:class II aldolase/adducin family protein [Burkholderiales bacterium]MDP2398514.1 class II aldolase/adducin family protein [Burkholderiales bacterium]
MVARAKQKHAVTRTARPRVARSRISATEWQARCELAAAHRLVGHFMFADLTYNHISLRVPGEPGYFLVKADNLLMEQVSASNLVKYDLDGRQVGTSVFKASPAAYNLHAAVLKARPDIHAAVHTHTPANLAVSAQQQGLLPLTQQAMRFYKRVARYPNEVDDTTREGADRLAAVLGEQWVMLLENHGVLVCGTTLPEAYIYHHFFELACRAQVGALAGGGKLILPNPAVCAARAAKFGRIGIYDSDSRDWVASLALVEKLYPDYKN